MSLRFNTLLIVPLSSLFYKKALFLMFVLLCAGPSMAQTVNEELKKNALKAYEEENYVLGYKLYSQLVANFPKDPEYNFRLGVCMIYAEPDKQKCLPYLKLANSKPESPKEVKFYLGKAYHINYLFDEAITNYNEYKNVGSSAQQKKLQVDREIKACGYGKRLLSNLSDLVIENKKQLNEADYFRSYNLKNIGGKLLAKPEDFKTSTDKKKKDKSIVYVPAVGNRVYYSSYGNGDNKDIYYSTKLPNGSFSPAQKVNGINSDQDEDYPFLHPNGTTLYFASKGYNSMGGYDIFKSTYIESSDSWSQPVNLEFPINSPDDDYLYVTDSLEKTAFFSTGRQSLPGKIDVLTISTERKPIDLLALKGTVVKESAEQSLKSRITVKNMDNGNIVGIIDARDNGDYIMELPNGANLLYTVETPGIATQSDKVSLPMVSTSKPLRQTISYDKGILKIINYFEETPTDDSYVQYLKIIEKKAKLEVNQGENKLGNALVNNTTTANEKNTEKNNEKNSAISKTDSSAAKTKTVENTTGITKNKTGLDNKQLSEMSRKEAEELAKEGTQLTQDANDAFELGNEKKIEADKKTKEAQDAIKVAESLTNEDEKKSALEKANLIKKEAESENALATKILSYANTLKEDASFKIQESNLNKEYADELAKTINNKNNSAQTLEKLDNIQKQIDAVSGHKNKSEEIFASFKNDAEEKEKEVSAKEKTTEDIKTNIQEIKEAITSNEADLAKAKKKEKEGIQNKITELKTDQAQKEKQYEISQAEVKTLKEELTATTKGVELATKIKNENFAVNTNTQAVTSNTTNISNATTTITPTNSVVEKTTSKTLAQKYKDKTTPADNTNKDNIEQNSTELKNYNTDIETVLAKDKTELSKTTNAATKQQLASEIKQLETVRKQNQQKIAANTKKIEDLNKAVVTNSTSTKNNEVDLITSNDNTDAINKLNNLNSNLNSNDNANFDYNGYQNPQAQKLKVEADTKINESVAQQKKLKDVIEITKGKINASSSTNTAVSPQQLSKEAEELSVKAFDLRSQASNKTGAEKDALMTQAKAEEAKANEKNLQLTEITKSDNKLKFDTEASNLKLLIVDKKASEGDLTEAAKLNDEANIAYKQAISIREEADSLNSTGAKLGSLSNAEEKEAEALIKQKQAIDLLKKSSPDVVLKKAITSADLYTDNSNGAVPNVNDQLVSVNNGVTELLGSKLSAYQKLFEANNMELEQLSGELKNNQSAIDKTPALKSDFISANNKVSTSQTLKQNSESETDNNKKIAVLIEATKKQTDALNQLSALNKKITSQQSVANQKNNDINTGANKDNPANNKNNIAVKTNTVSNPKDNKNTVATSTVDLNNKNNKVDTSKVVSNNKGNNNSAATKTVNTTAVTAKNNTAVKTNTRAASNNPSNNNANANNSVTNATTGNTVDVTALSLKDTSAAEIVSLFENKVTFKNQKANTLITNSLAELKYLDSESKALDNEIKNTQSTASGENAVQLKTKSDNLLTEAEEFSVKAFDLKTLANTKSGPERDSILQMSKKLDEESLNKKLDAVKLTEQANQLVYNTNNFANKELIEKLKKDDPELASQLSEKTNEISALKTKAQQLREEAQSQPNANARIGAMENAEEQEAAMIQKQKEVLAELKKRYPDYEVKETSVSSAGVPNNLKQKQTQLEEKKYDLLTNLINAFSLEYETSKKSTPTNLTADQKVVLQNAADMNAESKRLLIKASTEKNTNEKIKLLAIATKTGDKAVNILNTLPKTNTALVVTNPKNNNTTTVVNPKNGNTTVPADVKVKNNTTIKSNTSPANVSNNTNANNTNAGNGTIKVEGLEVIAGNAYTATKPIPVDAKVPEGLIFRVQIGAFKTKLPDNAFRGLNPLNAETAANGYIRYTAGNFNKPENATAVKNDLKNLGYTDAFVVVFYNGKRITMNEALELMAKEGKSVDLNASQTAGITANTNIPKATANVQNQNFNDQDAVAITKELEQINGLMYTVQIGVFNRQVSKGKLYSLTPIYTEKLPNGLYRYTAGIYNNAERLLTDKRKVVSLGISDAFVSAYLNGKRITFADGKLKQQDSSTKLEPENPIVFSEINSTINPTTATNTTGPVNENKSVQPFTNGVTSYPAATPDNGVKPSEEGISFKVQIGAYSKQVPNDVAAKFSAIKNWPVENKQINTLFIYNIGNFTEAKFAKALKDEAFKTGITDAFITVYKDGKKIYGTEASQYLNK